MVQVDVNTICECFASCRLERKLLSCHGAWPVRMCERKDVLFCYFEVNPEVKIHGIHMKLVYMDKDDHISSSPDSTQTKKSTVVLSGTCACSSTPIWLISDDILS